MQEMKAFTIRVPAVLVDQIDARAQINDRTRNSEINSMLKLAIDRSVASDIQVLKKQTG